MSELQARRDAQTRAELSTTAIALFAENGFVETTMADVAAAAGVSRRTAYRHYANKEDLIFEQARHWHDAFQAVIDNRLPDDSTKEVVSRGVLAVAATIEANRDNVLPGYAVVLATPSLRARYARTNRDWFEAYVKVLSVDIVDDNQTAILATWILAGALVGGTDQAVIYWFMHPGTSLVELTASVLDAVESMWPPATRS